ncbi:MAG: amidohydrolase family protein, partial [Clostridia bacterium]|nr:amidohydrolase family protein [Clostridia bacterium]
CLSPTQGGAQSTEALLVPSKADLRALIEACSHLRMMGVAPELDGALTLGRRLNDLGVVASVAHSDADYDTVARAALSGFSDVTHLYSGCSSVVRRNAFRVAGVVEAGLEMESLTVQVIADGCHLPLPLLRLIYRCKGPEKMYAVTDGLEFAASHQEEGVTYVQRNGQACVYEDGVMKLPSRAAFAGSVATMSRLVRTLVKAGIPIRDAIRMATDTPARRIGAAKKGRVAAGYDADLLLLDDSLRVSLVMAKGKIIRDTAEED